MDIDEHIAHVTGMEVDKYEIQEHMDFDATLLHAAWADKEYDDPPTGPLPLLNGMVMFQMYHILRSLDHKLTCSSLKRNDNTSYLRKQRKQSLLGIKQEPRATSSGLLNADGVSSRLQPLLTNLLFPIVPRSQMTNHLSCLFQMTVLAFRTLIKQRNLHRKTFQPTITINFHHRKINIPINKFHPRMVLMINSHLDHQLLLHLHHHTLHIILLHHIVHHLFVFQKNLDEALGFIIPRSFLIISMGIDHLSKLKEIYKVLHL